MRTPNQGFKLSLLDCIFMVGLTLLAVWIPCFVAGLHFFRHGSPVPSILQLVVGMLAAWIAAFFVGFNLWTSFVRPWSYRRAHGDDSGYQHVSGAPALGSILIWFAALFLPGSVWVVTVLLVLYLLDPGGIHVAAFVILRELFKNRKDTERRNTP